jgi:hypothetical protein
MRQETLPDISPSFQQAQALLETSAMAALRRKCPDLWQLGRLPCQVCDNAGIFPGGIQSVAGRKNQVVIY